MKTEIIKLDIYKPQMDKLNYAADILRNGGLVAFPTETVYGLGANALDESAVKGIFTAKGRPSDNPLIVHIPQKSSLEGIVKDIPHSASLLMDRFWPGPLTLVMSKSQLVPHIITAGLDTVAVRVPSHPIALELLKKAGIPVAAPSANTSGKPSPTTAKHVIQDLMGRVDVIIDAGSSEVGLESTVLDVTVEPAMILRPGGVTKAQLEQILGKVDIDPAIMSNIKNDLTPKSPGMKYLHYSPKADVIIVSGQLDNVVKTIEALCAQDSNKSMKIGILATDQTKDRYSKVFEVISAGDRHRPETIASQLFYALREFDDRGVSLIFAEAIDNAGIGMAIMNRMNKAAGYKIINADVY